MDIPHTLQILTDAYSCTPSAASATLSSAAAPEKRRGGFFPSRRPAQQPAAARKSDMDAPLPAFSPVPTEKSKPAVSLDVLRALRDWLVYALAAKPAAELKPVLDHTVGALIDCAREQLSEFAIVDDSASTKPTMARRSSGLIGALGAKKRSARDFLEGDVVALIEDDDDASLALNTLALIAGQPALLSALAYNVGFIEPLVALCMDALSNEFCASAVRAAAARTLANLSAHAKCLALICKAFAKQIDRGGVIRYAAVLKPNVKTLDRYEPLLRLLQAVHASLGKIDGNQARADVAAAASAVARACGQSPFRLPEDAHQSASRAAPQLAKWAKRQPSCAPIVEAWVDTLVLLSRSRMDTGYLELRRSMLSEMDLKAARLLVQREWEAVSSFDALPNVSTDALKAWREQNARLFGLAGALADFEALCAHGLETDPNSAAELLASLVAMTAGDAARRAAVLRAALLLVPLDKKAATVLAPLCESALGDARFALETDRDDGDATLSELSELVDGSLTGEVMVAAPRPAAAAAAATAGSAATELDDVVVVACAALAPHLPNAPRLLERVALLLVHPSPALHGPARTVLKACTPAEALRVLCGVLAEAPVGSEGTARALELLGALPNAPGVTGARALALFHAVAAPESPAGAAAGRLRADAGDAERVEARVLARARLRPLMRMSNRRAFARERANELVGCLRAVFACSTRDAPELESVWATVCEDAAGWPDWAVRRVVRAVLTGLSPDLATRAVAPLKSMLAFAPDLAANTRMVALVSALVTVATRPSSNGAGSATRHGGEEAKQVVAALVQAWLIAKAPPGGESSIDAVLNVCMACVELCTVPPGEEVVLLGPGPSAHLPAFMLALAGRARDFDTKQIAAMGLLAERFGARLAVKDRADFLDFVGQWCEMRPKLHVAVVAMRRIVDSDPTLASLELVANHVMSGSETHLMAVAMAVADGTSHTRASAEHMGLAAAILLASAGTAEALQSFVLSSGSRSDVADAACAMADEGDKLARSRALASVAAKVGLEPAAVVQGLFSLSKRAPACAGLAVPWLELCGAAAGLLEFVWGLFVLGGGRPVWEAALSGPGADADAIGRFLVAKARAGEDVGAPWRLVAGRGMVPDTAALMELPAGAQLLALWLQHAKQPAGVVLMSDVTLARVSVFILADEARNDVAAASAFNALAARLGVEAPATRARLLGALPAGAVGELVALTRQQGLVALFHEALEAHPTLVAPSDVALAAADALLAEQSQLACRLQRHLATQAAAQVAGAGREESAVLIGAVLGPMLWAGGSVGVEAGAALVALDDDGATGAHKAAARGWKDVRDDWPAFVAQSPRLGAVSLALLAAKLRAPEGAVAALVDLERAHKGEAISRATAVDDGYVRVVCALFAWDDAEWRRAALKVLAGADLSRAAPANVARAARFAFGELAASGETLALAALARCAAVAGEMGAGDEDAGAGPGRERVAAAIRRAVAALSSSMPSMPPAVAPTLAKQPVVASTTATATATGAVAKAATTTAVATPTAVKTAGAAVKKRAQEEALAEPDLERALSMEWLEELEPAVMASPNPPPRKGAAGDVATTPVARPKMLAASSGAADKPAAAVAEKYVAVIEASKRGSSSASSSKLGSGASTTGSATKRAAVDAPPAPSVSPPPSIKPMAVTRPAALAVDGADRAETKKPSPISVPAAKPARLVTSDGADKPDTKKPSPITRGPPEPPSIPPPPPGAPPPSAAAVSADAPASSKQDGTPRTQARTLAEKDAKPPDASAFSPIRTAKSKPAAAATDSVAGDASAARTRISVHGRMQVKLESVETSPPAAGKAPRGGKGGDVEHSAVLARPAIGKGKRQPPKTPRLASEPAAE